MSRFTPGQVVAKPGALAAFEASGESLLSFLLRHLAGDWGDLSEPDVYENEYALAHDLRLLSAYAQSRVGDWDFHDHRVRAMDFQRRRIRCDGPVFSNLLVGN
jgi:hypothetical protein